MDRIEMEKLVTPNPNAVGMEKLVKPNPNAIGVEKLVTLNPNAIGGPFRLNKDYPAQDEKYNQNGKTSRKTPILLVLDRR